MARTGRLVRQPVEQALPEVEPGRFAKVVAMIDFRDLPAFALMISPDDTWIADELKEAIESDRVEEWLMYWRYFAGLLDD